MSPVMGNRAEGGADVGEVAAKEWGLCVCGHAVYEHELLNEPPDETEVCVAEQYWPCKCTKFREAKA